MPFTQLSQPTKSKGPSLIFFSILDQFFSVSTIRYDFQLCVGKLRCRLPLRSQTEANATFPFPQINLHFYTMPENGSSILLLAGCGLLFLRPADVPLFARFAGRLAGTAVRGLRGLRSATEHIVKEGETIFHKQGADVSAVREDIQASFSKFESLRSAVTRDMAGVSAFAPVDILRSRIRGAAAANLQVTKSMKEKPTSAAAPLPSEGNTAMDIKRVASITHEQGSANKVTSGVDFIARSIEEAALAKQQNSILGGALPKERQDKGPS